MNGFKGSRKQGRNKGETQLSNSFKRKRKAGQDLELKFDVEDLKEYVNGFEKRKDQRRKHAIQQQLVKERQTKREAKQERIKQLKDQLNLPEDYGVQNSDEEPGTEDWKVRDVKVFSGAVVTTTEVKLHSDSDSEEEEMNVQPSRQDNQEKAQPKKLQSYQPGDDKVEQRVLKKKIKKRFKETKGRCRIIGKHKRRKK